MKPIRSIILLGSSLLLFILVYGTIGSRYCIGPFIMPVTFASQEAQLFPFYVTHEDDYNVELKLTNLVSDRDIDVITGLYINNSLTGLLAANWEILAADGQVVGRGSNRSGGFKCNSDDYRGLSLGTTHLNKGKYILALTFPGSLPEWNRFSPTVQLAIRRQDLEYLLVIFKYSLPLVIIFSIFYLLRRVAADKGLGRESRNDQYPLTP